jgi:outer membrane protein OmpA-like peptidoglycan-associated protein
MRVFHKHSIEEAYMQSGGRAIAIVVLPFFLAALAFAGDANKPATNPPANPAAAATTASTAATDTTATNTAPAAEMAPAPSAAAKSSDSSRSDITPRGEIFLGYSYIRFNTNSALVPGGPGRNEHFDMIPGGVAQAAGNINNWFGLAGDFGSYALYDVGNTSAKMYTYLFGPRFTYRSGRWVVFANAFGGGARISSTVSGPTDTNFFAKSFHSNAAAAAIGGGVDMVTGTKHLAIRLGEMEYLLTTFADNRNDRQQNLRVSGGVVWRFGFPSAPPPPPAVVHHPPTPAACSADPSSIQEGGNQSVAVKADTTSPDGNPLTYTWSATGGAVDGTGPQVHWNPGGAGPGTYTVSAKVTDSFGGATSCSTDITITPRPHTKPTMVSCTADPVKVDVPGKSTITATVKNPDNDPLTFNWQASRGQITGSGATVTFDSTGLDSGPVTVTGRVSTAAGSDQCTVNLQVSREIETRLALHSIYFPTAQPTTKDPNGGLVASQVQTLTNLASDFKKYLALKPDAYLTLRGHTDPRGGAKFNQALSERRVGSVKNFLIQHGVPESAIKTEALGEEHQLTEAEVKQMTQEDPSVTAQQKATILKNLRTITLAQNRRVDVQLSTQKEGSARLYPFNAADAANLLNPKGAAAPKTPRKGPARKGPARKAPATKKQ